MTTQEVFTHFIEPSSVFTDADKDFLQKELPRIKRRYDQWHRGYHNWNHVIDLLDLAFGKNGLPGAIPQHIWHHLSGQHSMQEPNVPVVFESMGEAKAGLLITILYHDVVYNQTKQEDISERLSAIFFLKSVQELEGEDSFIARSAKYVIEAIKETSAFKEPTNPLSVAIRHIDQYNLFNPNTVKEIDIIGRLAHEYRHIPFEEFLIGRKSFLEKWAEFNKQSGVSYDGLKIFSKRKPVVGIYEISGSVLHMGHWSVIEQAMKMFDRVLILLGGGDRKYADLPYDSVKTLQERFPFINFWQKRSNITDIANTLSNSERPVLIKSIRNQKDLEYELSEFDFCNEVFDEEAKIPVVFIPIDAAYRHINQKLIKRVWVSNRGLDGNPDALLHLVPSMQDLGYSQEELDEMLLGSYASIENLLESF
jgi:phosphopantetheine adenylyltransferase